MNERLRWNRLSMRYRVLFVFFILIVVPFLLVGYIALSKSEKTIRSTNLDAVVLTGKNLNYYFRYVEKEQDKLMASDDMQRLMSKGKRLRSDEIVFTDELLSFVDDINYSNALFKIRVLPLDPYAMPTYMRSVYGMSDVGAQPWYREIVTSGRSYWKVFEPAELPGVILEPTLGSVKRLHSLKTYEPLGVVVMDIRPSVLADFIYPVKQFPNQLLLLLTKDNRLVYSTKGKYDDTVLEAGLIRALGRADASTTLTYGGRKSLVSVTTLKDDELKLVSITPVKDLDNPVSVLSRLNYTFLLFYFLLSISLAAYITVTYTNPISSLVREMRAAVRHRFGEAAVVESRFAGRRDEIGWLYRGMYNMIREIQRLLRETKASEKRKKQLEFEVLNYQINPHFLYNTLDTIRWKAEARDAGDIGELASSLASLFRLTLNRGRALTTVRRELELLRSYLRIETARRDGPIPVMFRVEDELLDLPLMRLVLQPLVENAIRHGIADKGDEGMIVIQGSLEEGKIALCVSDNGPGIPEDIRIRLLDPDAAFRQEREGGLGLLNVHERLQHYFGAPYGLEVVSRPGKGTTVVLLHPILPDTERAGMEE
ncbi:sensor histidine kinase [Cohnella sp. REN36]|uniref:cache domain-containing sensor histidine kinase n=1 Tax=Cohnella sp. REN36 TaxID=2887347 RepID=UPI001D14FDB6|nr:sensor histidine kinase [Cohnella sp. REN36]MCC3371957.1 sensor histidine kinase [Cohnella sp. REN36]